MQYIQRAHAWYDPSDTRVLLKRHANVTHTTRAYNQDESIQHTNKTQHAHTAHTMCACNTYDTRIQRIQHVFIIHATRAYSKCYPAHTTHTIDTNFNRPAPPPWRAHDRREEDQRRHARELEAERKRSAKARSDLDVARSENVENRRRASKRRADLETALKDLIEEHKEMQEENEQLVKENTEFRERLGEEEEEEGPEEGVE